MIQQVAALLEVHFCSAELEPGVESVLSGLPSEDRVPWAFSDRCRVPEPRMREVFTGPGQDLPVSGEAELGPL